MKKRTGRPQINDFDGYKAFTSACVEFSLETSRGEWGRLAKALGMHPSQLSQVFRGDRDLNAEQAYLLCAELGLGKVETELYLAWVELGRASRSQWEDHLRARIERLRKNLSAVKRRMPEHRVLDEKSQELYYSDWSYSAARLFLNIPRFQLPSNLARALGLTEAKTQRVLATLVELGLARAEGKLFRREGLSTHLPAESRHVGRHHSHWRVKALDRVESPGPDSLFFTGPVVLSTEDAREVRKLVLGFIEGLSRRIEGSADEEAWCLNVDWFRASRTEPGE